MEHGEKETIEYGVNVEGSAFSCDPHDKLGRSKWNLKVIIIQIIMCLSFCSLSYIYILLMNSIHSIGKYLYKK